MCVLWSINNILPNDNIQLGRVVDILSGAWSAFAHSKGGE